MHYVVDADLRNPLDEDEAEELIDELAQHHAVVGWSATGQARITLTLHADSFAAAMSQGVELIGAERTCTRITVTDERERDRELEEDLLSVSQVAERLGISRQSVTKRILNNTLSAHKVGQTYVIPASTLRTTIASTKRSLR